MAFSKNYYLEKTKTQSLKKSNFFIGLLFLRCTVGQKSISLILDRINFSTIVICHRNWIDWWYLTNYLLLNSFIFLLERGNLSRRKEIRCGVAAIKRISFSTMHGSSSARLRDIWIRFCNLEVGQVGLFLWYSDRLCR